MSVRGYVDRSCSGLSAFSQNSRRTGRRPAICAAPPCGAAASSSIADELAGLLLPPRRGLTTSPVPRLQGQSRQSFEGETDHEQKASQHSSDAWRGVGGPDRQSAAHRGDRAVRAASPLPAVVTTAGCDYCGWQTSLPVTTVLEECTSQPGIASGSPHPGDTLCVAVQLAIHAIVSQHPVTRKRIHRQGMARISPSSPISVQAGWTVHIVANLHLPACQSVPRIRRRNE